MARRGDAIYLRGKTWWLDFTHQGQRHAIRLGRIINRTAAREIASVKRAGILKGEAGIGKKRKDLSFEKASTECLKWAEANKRPNTVASYRQCLVHLGRSFGAKRMSEIHPFIIEKHRRGRIDAGAKVAANRELTALRALFNRCREWKLYEGDNPAAGVKLTKEPRGRDRFLEPEEEARLLAVAKEPLRTIILTGVHAGLRIHAEALTLRWADVDLKRGLLTVQAAYAKSGQTRIVPINTTLREALGRMRERDRRDGYVFARPDGGPRRNIRTAFENACERAGLKDVTPHTLRHTFASRLAMAGVDLRTIQEVGGWSDLKMVERYSHLTPDHKAEAVERIAGGIPQRYSQHGGDKEAVGSALVVVN